MKSFRGQLIVQSSLGYALVYDTNDKKSLLMQTLAPKELKPSFLSEDSLALTFDAPKKFKIAEIKTSLPN